MELNRSTANENSSRRSNEDASHDERQNAQFCPAPFFEESVLGAASTSANWAPITVSEANQRMKSRLPLRRIRIYSDGVFDLFHGGHAEQFRQAKCAFQRVHLIVVCSDEDVERYKGTRPTMTVDERCDTVRHCRYVDEVIRCPPFYFSLQFLDSIQADMAAHDALPYGAPDSADCYAPFKRADRFLTTQRKPHISTSQLVARIVHDVDVYRRRDAARGVIDGSCHVPDIDE